MTRKLKALGLAAMAVFALSALAASAAQAHTAFTSNSPNGRTVITGHNEEGSEKFTLAGETATIECTTSKFAGTASENSVSSLTVTPTYGNTANETECKETAFGSKAVVHTNHCAYVFTLETDANGDAPVHVECSGGSQITITVPELGIEIHIPEQTPTGGVHYTDIGNNVTVQSTVTGISSTCTGSEFFCHLLFGTDTTDNAGGYKGKSVVEGFEDTGSELTGTEKTTQTYTHGASNLNLGIS